MKALIAGLLCTTLCGGALAQQFPSKPVRLVVHLAAGGSTDIVARAMAQKLTAIWGEQVLVDNRPGGATVIGTEIVSKSPPDGYTLLVAAAPLVINTLLMPRLPYAMTDFVAISLVNTTPLVLIVHPNVPAKSVEALIKLARSQPGKLNFGSASIGGAGHLAGELFNVMAGLKMTHIPYKGNTPALADLQERLKAQGADPVGSTAAQYSQFLHEEGLRWAKVIKFAGVKPE